MSVNRNRMGARATSSRSTGGCSGLRCRWIGLLLVTAPACFAAGRTRALPPEEALKTFQLEPGLRIELVAAEPLVVDPVAFAFDELGRLYVAENRGYPDPIGGGPTTQGRIALLTDTDGDGRFDRRAEFATGLGFVNGLTVWRGGVFVTAAPDILYLKDQDGDGVADERRVVLTGFDASKSTQLRVSHPTLGLDGKVYLTSGLTGGKVTSPEHPNRPPVTFTPRDSRFEPDTLEFENTGGRAQFGLAFDAFGRRFICSNRHPVLQVMLEPWHLSRNPHLASANMVQEVSKVEAEARVSPISRATVTADFVPALMAKPHSGTFTSACGVFVFGGTGLTPAHVGNVFVCEPAQNLVQRQVFRPEGPGLRSDPPHRGKEFLASTDTWFRPVFLGSGPDGALYVADMHRREIDHPVYVPAEARAQFDFEGGKDAGRIYRIVADGLRRPQTAIAMTPADLVRGLESPDEWRRACSHRLLLESRDDVASIDLEEIATKSSQPESRARAQWVLHGLKKLSSGTVAAALKDTDARVREQAVVLAEKLLPHAASLLPSMLAAAGDSDARVRFCVALTLGSVADERVVPALAAIAARDGEDRWTRAAVLGGVGSRMDAFLDALQSRQSLNPAAFAIVMEDLGRMMGAAATPDACRKLLQAVLAEAGAPGWRISSALGLAAGLRSRGKANSSETEDPLAALVRDSDAPHDANSLRTLYRLATERALAGNLTAAERVPSISLLGYTSVEIAKPTLEKLLDAREPAEVQLHAVRALERLGDRQGAGLLLANGRWSRYTPQLREAVIAALMSKTRLIEVLFEAIRQKQIAAVEVPSTRRTQLLKHADSAVRADAERLFKDLEGGDRMKVYQQFRELLGKQVDVARGREAFVRMCSACHTHGGLGGKVGPDLTGVRNQPADTILLHIIVPNYEVAPSFQTLVVTTSDGRSLSGWLAAETETSLTLRTAAGTEETVLRKNITSLTTSGASLMPDGLEQALEKQDVANLVAFLKSGNGK